MVARASRPSNPATARRMAEQVAEGETSNIEHPTSNGAGAPDVRRSMFDVGCWMLISFSLVGRGVNIRDGHKLAEQMHFAGLVSKIKRPPVVGRGGGNIVRKRLGARQHAVFEHAQLQFHRGG